MYLSDKAKVHVKQILMLWDELGHEPSFNEFNSDPRTPAANSLAFHFGSYSKGVEIARRCYYDKERRKELEDQPEDPVPIPNQQKPKRGKKHSPLANGFRSKNRPGPKASSTVQPAPETPQEAPPEPPKEAPQVIPVLETPQKSPEPLESPSEPEDAKIPAPDAKTPQTQKEPPSPTITEKEVKFMNFIGPGIVNLLSKPLALVDEKTFQRIIAGESIEVYAKNNDDGTAVVLSGEIIIHYIGDPDSDIPFVAVTRTFSEPKLIKDNRQYNFPDPKDGKSLIVSKEVIEAARGIGRDIDDLFYPKRYIETDTIIYCNIFDSLQS